MAEITIKSGDTLWALAQKHGTTVKDLAALNGITNPDLIIAGAQLKVPGDASTAGAPSSSPNGTSTLGLPGTSAAPGTPAASATEAPTGEAVTDKAGQVPYINQYQPSGNDGSYTNGPSNCGPSSMAMIARAYGYGQGMSDAQLINHLGRMGGTTGAGTGVNGIAAMAQGMGKGAETRGPGANVDWIRQQLEAGKLVVANGDYYAMPPHDASKIGSGGHYVSVIGLDANGNFLVNDPADSGISPRAFTADQLARFISSNANGGYQVAVG